MGISAIYCVIILISRAKVPQTLSGRRSKICVGLFSPLVKIFIIWNLKNVIVERPKVDKHLLTDEEKDCRHCIIGLGAADFPSVNHFITQTQRQTICVALWGEENNVVIWKTQSSPVLL